MSKNMGNCLEDLFSVIRDKNITYKLSHLLSQAVANRVHNFLKYKSRKLERFEIFMDMVRAHSGESCWLDIVQTTLSETDLSEILSAIMLDFTSSEMTCHLLTLYTLLVDTLPLIDRASGRTM